MKLMILSVIQFQWTIEPQSVLCSHTNVSFMFAKTKEFLNCWCSYESNKFTKDFLLLIACSFLAAFTENA